MIRGLTIADALAYVTFRKKAPINEAIANASGSTNRLGLLYLVGRSPLPDVVRSTWINVERGQITGLVSVRSRLGADIWDIDQLATVPSPTQLAEYAELLSHVVSSAYAEGVQRIFLRVQAGSDAESASRQVGFCTYTSEAIHLVNRIGAVPSQPSARLRPRRPIDHLSLFQLYSAAVPARVRQIEGMTLREWRATDGWRLYPMHWHTSLSSGRRDFVVERDGAILAWLQVEPRTSVLRLLIQPQAQVDIGEVISQAARYMPRNKQILVPIRDYEGQMQSYLEAQDFPLVARHALLSRSLAVRVVEPRLVRRWREGVPVREAGM